MVCYRKPEEPSDDDGGDGEDDLPNPLPNPSGKSFNCTRLQGDPPFELVIAENYTVEQYTQYKLTATRIGTFRSDDAYWATETSEPGFAEPIPSSEWENIGSYLEDRGWRLEQRRRMGTWTTEETFFRNSISITVFFYVKDVFRLGWQWGGAGDNDADFQHNKWITQIFYKLEVNSREEKDFILKNHQYAMTYPNRLNRYVAAYNPRGSPRYEWAEEDRTACVSGPVQQSINVDPPILPPRRKPVTCCPDTQDRLDFMIHHLGLKRFPVPMEDSLTDDKDTTRNVDNMAEFQFLFLRYFMEAVGEFPVKLNVVTDEGDRSGEVIINNMAEFIALNHAKNFAIKKDADAAWAGSIATLGQTTQLLSMQTTVLDYVEAISQFLAYKANTIEREIELPFNPQANPFTSSQREFFTTTKVKTLGHVNEDKATFYAFMEKAHYILGLMQHELMTQGTEEELEDYLNDLERKILGPRTTDEIVEEAKKETANLKAIQDKLNEYQKANGLPEITIKRRV